MRIWIIALILTLITPNWGHTSEVYQCQDKRGNRVYQDSPCESAYCQHYYQLLSREDNR